MAEYIEREALRKVLRGSAVGKYPVSFYMGLFAAADELEKMPPADVAPVVYCRDCVHHNRCMAERIYKSDNIENPYCCRGERKDGEG